MQFLRTINEMEISRSAGKRSYNTIYKLGIGSFRTVTHTIDYFIVLYWVFD